LDRAIHKDKKISSQANYSIYYTGEELNQYDSQVLWAILHIQKTSGVEIGKDVSCYQLEIIKLIGMTASGAAYETIYQSLKRLTSCMITIEFEAKKRSTKYHGHIIESLKKDENGHYVFRLGHDMAKLFESDCSIVMLRKKIVLSHQLSKWLFDYSSSHSKFIDMPINNLISISGYPNSKSEFIRNLKLSCQEIISKLNKDAPFVDYKVSSTCLNLYKFVQKEQSVLSLEEELDSI